MLNPIRFSGLSLNKDELAVDNGELAVCAGVELKGGFVRPSVLAGTTLGNLVVGSASATLLYVHNTGSYTHYLAYYTDSDTVKLVYFDKVSGDTESISSAVEIGALSFDVSELKDIDSVGNTLILLDSDGLAHYLLWRDDAYEELPQKPPMLEIMFRLGDSQMAEYPQGDVTEWTGNCKRAFRKVSGKVSDAYTYSGGNITINDDYKSAIQNTVYALMNEANAVVTKAGHFYAPFLIRYCYRMYDGSYFMHSFPVFLPTTMPAVKPVGIANATYSSSEDKITFSDTTYYKTDSGEATDPSVTIGADALVFTYIPSNCPLQFRTYAMPTEFNKWEDIIKSLDIFISQPLTNLTTDRSITTATGSFDTITSLYNGKRDTVFDRHVNMDVPTLSFEKYFENVDNNATFFLLKSINFNDISSFVSSANLLFKDLDIDEAVLANIEVQKQLTDDYKSHNLLKAEGSYIYNHRINLWGLQESLYNNFPYELLYTDLDTNYITAEDPDKYFRFLEFRVRIHTEDKDYIVSSTGPDYSVINYYILANHFQYLPLFYPDARAVELFIIYDTGPTEGTKYVDSFPMEESSGLNGAWTSHKVILTKSQVYTDDICPVSSDLWVDMPSKVYTGGMDNPYYFPLAGINTVGTGTIIGLASTTRALSQGQFGQYPLIAFTTDGIWALEVSSSGTYSSIHPISREVATSKDGICQLDQAVIFISSRGANILQESQVTPLSDILIGVAPGMLDPAVPTSLYPEMVAGISKYYSGADATQLTTLASIQELPIKFLQHALTVNDSNNQRVFFIDKQNSGIALVLSLDAMTWSYMAVPTNLVYVQGYPYAYISYPVTVPEASTSGNTLVRLDTQYDYLSTQRYVGMILTRTLSFGGLYDAITGFRQSHSIIASADESLRPHLYLYGSNDLRSWHFIGHSVADRSTYLPAHSFRYFRIGLLLSMRPAEQYMQTTLDITEKYDRL